MAELRTDWLTGRTVILAENRAERPNEFVSAAGAGDLVCPFCPGQEWRTPPPVFVQNDDEGRWRVRVVPNMYPAVSVETPVMARLAAWGAAVPALGAQEVIIESARHVDRLSALSVSELAGVLAAFTARLGHWHDDGRFQFGLVFKNLGPMAGASLSHLHSQLVALPYLPPSVAAEFQRAQQFFRDQGVCPYCRLIEHEQAAGERIVLDRDGWIAFCPFASLQPCEVWLLPKEHEPWYERRPQSRDSDRLANVLHELIVRLETILPHADYNLLLRTTPWQEAASGVGHWRIEVLPRTNPLAGLELGVGIHINPLSPSRAAESLRLS